MKSLYELGVYSQGEKDRQVQLSLDKPVQFDAAISDEVSHLKDTEKKYGMAVEDPDRDAHYSLQMKAHAKFDEMMDHHNNGNYDKALQAHKELGDILGQMKTYHQKFFKESEIDPDYKMTKTWMSAASSVAAIEDHGGDDYEEHKRRGTKLHKGFVSTLGKHLKDMWHDFAAGARAGNKDGDWYAQSHHPKSIKHPHFYNAGASLGGIPADMRHGGEV